MKTLQETCIPRESVFDRTKRDTVLDLTDLLEDKSDGDRFFEENYLTKGMKVLFKESFRRFQGKSDQGVFLLSQAMGGGKNHNMSALGLLAKYPHLRTFIASLANVPDAVIGLSVPGAGDYLGAAVTGNR
ncbi:MAG: hypothetical protein N5P05_002779 [Chroococcopsis gigantea SAG 12.99]|jgi:predicted AAA+ superfamily ATPase|nr:hypothetical protein [Chroococcopsis gigantea SAG 12.99]